MHTQILQERNIDVTKENNNQLFVMCVGDDRSDEEMFIMVWYGVVWCGMVWCGIVWYGMVWYGMVWYGMIRYGVV